MSKISAILILLLTGYAPWASGITCDQHFKNKPKRVQKIKTEIVFFEHKLESGEPESVKTLDITVRSNSELLAWLEAGAPRHHNFSRKSSNQSNKKTVIQLSTDNYMLEKEVYLPQKIDFARASKGTMPLNKFTYGSGRHGGPYLVINELNIFDQKLVYHSKSFAWSRHQRARSKQGFNPKSFSTFKVEMPFVKTGDQLVISYIRINEVSKNETQTYEAVLKQPLVLDLIP